MSGELHTSPHRSTALADLPIAARAAELTWTFAAREARLRSGGGPGWAEPFRPLLTPPMLRLRAAGYLENRVLGAGWAVMPCPALASARAAEELSRLRTSGHPAALAILACCDLAVAEAAALWDVLNLPVLKNKRAEVDHNLHAVLAGWPVAMRSHHG